MPEFQPVSSAAIAAIERPRCPECNQNRMLLSKLGAGPSGFDHRTFECQKCGRVHTTVVSSDPMNSATGGWLVGDLGCKNALINKRPCYYLICGL